MGLWNDFLHGALPYQHYWLPFVIGVAVGFVCILTGNLVWRSKEPAPARKKAEPPSSEYDPFVQGSMSEQRKSYRRGGNLVEVLYARPESKDKGRHALVVDRSMGGVRLVAEEDVAAGTRLMVLPIHAPEATPWVEIEVRASSLVDDSWELRCQFVNTPPWSVLLLFG